MAEPRKPVIRSNTQSIRCIGIISKERAISVGVTVRFMSLNFEWIEFKRPKAKKKKLPIICCVEQLVLDINDGSNAISHRTLAANGAGQPVQHQNVA